MSTIVRVVVADDQRLVREGLISLVRRLPGIELVATAGNGAEALAAVEGTRPDVVLMDLEMPRMDGIEATRRIRERHPQTAVIALTIYADDQHLFGALRAGAAGYLTKDSSAEDVLRAILAVHRGQGALDAAVQRRVIAATGPAGRRMRRGPALPDGLTTREAEVLGLVASGLSNAEIAQRLHLSEATVKRHLHNLFGKAGLRDRAQAVAYAFKRGLAS